MSETTGAAVETKQRITRSSIGHTAAASSANTLDSMQETGVAELSMSPGPQRAGATSSMSTPGQDAPTTSTDSATPESTAATPVMAKRKMGVAPAGTPQTTRRSLRSSNKLNTDEESDQYCWRCRKDGTVIPCQLCPRVYHLKCLDLTSNPVDDWICVECEKVMRSECEDTRPKALSNLSMDQLITCLQFALERMKVPNSEVFQVPVDPAMEPEYHNIIAHPMDMSQLEKNIKKKMYGSTQAFLADAMWILHNSILYNGVHNKYTMTAKAVLKMCRNQMTEIETCPDCFLASCTQEHNWFCKPCRYSHPLVWAKLKGYPFWPAKALRENDGQVDCRFFGAHDKAWLPANQVFMLSSEPPAPVKNKKGSGFEEAMAELDRYITKFKARYGAFNYAPVKEPYKSDYGQSAAGETKKRKLASPTSSEGPQVKKQPVVPDQVIKQEPSSAHSPAFKEDKPVIKTEPEKPGVFTISDDLLAGATNFSVIKDEEVAPIPTNSVVSKIEETLKSAEEHEVSGLAQTNGDMQTEDQPSEEKSNDMDISDTSSQPTVSDQSTTSSQLANQKQEEDNPATTTKDAEPSISVETTKTVESAQPMEPTKSIESAQSMEPTKSVEPAQAVEPTKSDGSKSNKHMMSAESDVSVKPNTSTQPANSQSVESVPESSKCSESQPIIATDEEYKQKLERTIESCKNSLGVDNLEEENISEESESESDSESEYESYYTSKSKRRYSYGPENRKQRKDVRAIMTEKELEVTRQLLQVMKESLQPTIRDVVRQTLLGQAPVQAASNDSNNQTSQTESKTELTGQTGSASDSIKQSDLDGSMKMAAFPPNGEIVPKTEPLTENTNQENSLDTGTDPSVNKELAEKLTWKHKCEIEAVKHNAELAAMEMRKSIELEKERALWRLRKQLEHKFKKIIEETKKKQWCAMCGKEAIFYCCWNTSYCDYPCQQKHWPNHLKTCAQISKDDGDKKAPQPQPPHQRSQSPGSATERTPQPGHSSSAPPPYMPTSSASEAPPPAPQYQLMQGQQVQYMPAPGTVQPNPQHVYQAQLPVQAMPMQSGPRNQASSTGAPMLYPVMTPPPPSAQGPPQPQSYMLSQRQPYRLAPKYS